MSHHVTEFKNVKYTYPGGSAAVEGISLTIRHGESVGIIGANGAGKSTLLMLLLGLLTPEEGEIRVGETRLTAKTADLIRAHIGMVFQDPNNQLFMSSVYDDVAFGPRNMGLAEDEVAVRVKEALEAVGIPHLAQRAPFRLSEGEKRAAAIATVIAMRPDILVMDEPSSSLDARARRSLIRLLKSFSHTKIITSHDLDMMLEVCGRVVLIHGGKIAADGPSLEILKNKALLEEAGLELPLKLQGCPVCGG